MQTKISKRLANVERRLSKLERKTSKTFMRLNYYLDLFNRRITIVEVKLLELDDDEADEEDEPIVDIEKLKKKGNFDEEVGYIV